MQRYLLKTPTSLFCSIAISACVSSSHPTGHPLAVFYLDYAAFPQGFFNSGLLDAGSIFRYDAYAERRGEKPIVRKITPQLDASAWNAPASISQKMKATTGGSLQVDPSVIIPSWKTAIQAEVLRETTLDLKDGKKHELVDPASVVTKTINDPKYVGEFKGYANPSRYTLLVVASYVDGTFTVTSGLDPKSNHLSVSVLGKRPVDVDISNLRSASGSGSKILVGLKSYTIKLNRDGSLDVVEDPRNRAWSDLLTKSSPF